MKEYRIRGWAKFQHFKDRRPPWIKLYKDILDDPDWHALDGESAKVLVALWLLASEDEGKNGAIPELRKLAFRLRIKENEAKQHLTKLSPWLIHDDIDTISTRYHDDAPETETETETETDKIPPLPPKPKRATKKTPQDLIDAANVNQNCAQDVLLEWVEYKQSSSKPYKSPRGVTASSNVLAMADISDQAMMVQKAITGGWQGLPDPPRKNNASHLQRSKSASDRARETADEYFGRSESEDRSSPPSNAGKLRGVVYEPGDNDR